MPSIEDLQRMYTTAKIVLHNQLARELAQSIGKHFTHENGLQEQDVLEYFQGKYVSDLSGKAQTLRALTNADVSQFSTDFLVTFWFTLIDTTGEGPWLAAKVHPSEIVKPLHVVERYGFVDVVIDIPVTAVEPS